MVITDEVRYMRVCLLVLNVCPHILRKVFENYFIHQGCQRLQHFLDTRKHDLYHLLPRTCCCRFKQNRTLLNRTQWDLLYVKNTASCIKGHRGDCPCQFDAIQGITTNVMDVTLCCLFLSNVCSGVNISHIHTIRDVRNKLVHNKGANLDEMQFYDYWNRVKTALIDLASHVSQALHKETLAMVQQLETQVIGIDDLSQELRRLLVDQKKNLEESLKEKIDGIDEDLDNTTQTVNEMAGKVQQLEERFSETNITTEGQQKHIDKLKGRLLEINEDMTKIIPISPLQERGEKELPLEQLYASVVVCEDSKYSVKGPKIKAGHSHRVLKAIGLMLVLVIGLMSVVGAELVLTFVLYFGVWVCVGSGLGKGRYLSLGIGFLMRAVYEMVQENLGEESKLNSISTLGIVVGLTVGLRLRFGLAIPVDYIKNILKGFAGEQISAKQEIFPEDIFKIDRRIARIVYLLGDAARGKTTYSLWLLKIWCNAKQDECRRKKKLKKMEQTLKKFDFVFLLQLRHTDPNMASVIDMICFDLFERETNYHATIRHVLSSEQFRCLIIMDGLDEWNPSKQTRKRLVFQGMPNINKMSNTVTCLFSMRPWMLSRISGNIKINDRVIEILGLSEAGIEHVIANVLINHYELKKGTSKYEETCKKIINYIDDKNLKSFMQIPLLAVVCVQIWYEGKDVGDNMTSFYTAMVNMLIERAHLKHDTHLLTQSTNKLLPEVFSAKKNIKDCIDVLIKLGKVAYEGMLSKQVKIIFEKESLQNEIGDRELQFALDTGLISQTEAPSILTRNVSVHFFHQTIQELLAALYIVTQKEASYSFCKHLSDVKVILELSNIIMFVCGMSQVLGSVLSKEIANVTDKDNEICLYRESPLEHRETVKELYELLVTCYQESRQESSESTEQFHISDIYLDVYSRKETVTITRKLLKDRRCIIKSLFIEDNFFQYGITNRELDEFLSNKYNTRSLVMVCIVSDWFRCLQHICIPSLKNLHVSGVMFSTTPCIGINPSLLMDMGHWSRVFLSPIMGGIGLSLSAAMLNIERIHLDKVKMTEKNWRDFVLSLSNVQHEFDVELEDTDIDDNSKELIKSSSIFATLESNFVGSVFRFKRI